MRWSKFYQFGEAVGLQSRSFYTVENWKNKTCENVDKIAYVKPWICCTV